MDDRLKSKEDLIEELLKTREELERLRSRETESALFETEERYREFVEGTDNLVIQVDQQGIFTFVNHSAKTYYGISPDDCIGMSCFDFIHPEDRDKTRALFDKWIQDGATSETCENRLVGRTGDVHYMLWSVNLHYDSDSNIKSISSIARDITERKRTEELLQRQALHDRLTDLPNRTLFLDRLNKLIKTTRRRPNYRFSVLFLDLDGFKAVNDSLGHLIGDQLLVAVARRLETCLRAGDSVARLGGDEFTILMEDIDGHADAERLAERAIQRLALPFNLDGHELFTSVSIGIVVSGSGLYTAEDLLQRADIAMYRAKDLGKGRHVLFDQAMHEDTVARHQLELDLRKAVLGDQFRAHYLPVISLNTGRIIGFDALVRWAHPEKGIIQPGDFVPIAEEIGTITYIDEWILGEACRQTRHWQTRFPDAGPLTICVNLSANQLMRRDLTKQMERILNESALDPSSVTLEIRESVLMENAQTISETLTSLKKLGVRLQIDNFGTGFSSLRLLHQLPIDMLKIDFSFVGSIDKDQESLDLIRTILNLARSLDVVVTAEGIELINQLNLLKEMNCEFGQGFLFSKPLDPWEAEALLESGKKW